jgi:hypothetical protein
MDDVRIVKAHVIDMLKDCIHEKHRAYLEDSDALLEYFRIYKAYSAMVKHEYANKTRFDYIVRIRPDAIFCAPIFFPSHCNLSSDSFSTRLSHIRQKYTSPNEILAILIHSFFLPHRVESKKPVDFMAHSLDDLDRLVPSQDEKKLLEFIENGKYMITIGKNLMFVTPRRHFGMLACLGVSYGQHFLPNFKQWLDPPAQFQICALLNGYTIFDSMTKQEMDVIRNFNADKVNLENGFMFVASG